MKIIGWITLIVSLLLPGGLVLRKLHHKGPSAESDCSNTEGLSPLMARGKSFFDSGNFQAALSCLEAAERTAVAKGAKKEQSLIAVRMGRIHQAQGLQTKAYEDYNRASTLADALNDDRLRAEALIGKAALEYTQSSLSGALRIYETCRTLAGEDVSLKARAEAGIGLIHYARGDYDLALRYYTESLAKEEALGSAEGKTRMLINLGAVYTKLEDYARSLGYFQQGLELAQSLKNRPLTASALTNIGVVRHLSENLSESLEYYQEAEVIHSATGNQEALLAILIRIGQVYYALGEFEPSKAYYQRALTLARELNHRHLGWIHQCLGELLTAQGRLPEALEHLKQGLEYHARMGQKEPLARDLASLASAYAQLSDLTSALSHARQAEDLARSIGSKKTQWDAYCIEGDVLRSVGRTKGAARAYRSAIRAIEEVRSNVSSWEVGQQTFFESRLEPYREMVQIHLGNRHYRAALSYAEMAKARSLLDRMQRRNGWPQGTRDRQELAAVSTGDLGAALDAGTVAVEYVVTKGRTQVFVLSPAAGPQPALHTFSIDVPAEVLLEKSRQLRTALEERTMDFVQPAKLLYKWLVEPAEGQLVGKDTVCFIPDGGLWDLPFQALMTSNDQFLLERHAVFYAPSLAGLRALKGRANKTSRCASPTLLAMGNPTQSEPSLLSQETSYRGLSLGPLPEAETEVQTIGRLYDGGKAEILVGPKAREATVKQQAGDYGILHFATHGVLDNLNPMRSYLLLSTNQDDHDEDGRLEAQEMMNLTLEADLVVLAACQTGRGKIRNGEGLLGMSWALFVAGCPSTIVSQWKVDSASTMKLMVDLHRNLQSGRMAKAAALQMAALQVKSGSLYRHPHYWTPFVLIGANSCRWQAREGVSYPSFAAAAHRQTERR
ncbi:MAG: CHAT domain-containing protein [Acidobacteriota bacterium]